MNEINELLDEFEDLKIKNLKVYEAPTSLFGKIKAGFNTVINKVKSSDFGRRCAALVLAGTMTFSLAGCAGKTQAEDANDNYAIVETQLSNFDNMLNKSQSEIQKATLGSVKDFLVYFNTTFADDHIEPDKDIRAALSWDEVIALTTLYNDFSNQDIIQIYNAADLDSYQMLTDYKTGFLILMGAHVLENSSVPVKLDMLLQTQEAKDYYNKYHELFLAAKESTGETQLNYVKNFFAQVRADFPISMESRRSNVGIAHADPRNGLKDYYYSILPILSAAEIMFQNLDIDYTLNDEEIALINELGICNLAESRYNNVALLAATAGKKSEYADYEALKKELESVLTLNGTYVIDDAHRELTLLDEFFEKIKDGLKKSGGYWIISTSTYTVVTREEVESREEAIRRAGEEKVKDAEEAVDNAFKDENDKAKAEAEKKAEEEAKRLQEEADKKTAENEEKVKNDEKDLQDKIDDANDKINNGETVNEDDLGHGTKFDDDYSDGNGNLDDSVTDITTDPIGASDPSDPLPDPNETGAEFDARSYSASYDYIESPEQSVYDGEEAYATKEISNEELADMLVEMMATAKEAETVKVYTHKM